MTFWPKSTKKLAIIFIFSQEMGYMKWPSRHPHLCGSPFLLAGLTKGEDVDGYFTLQENSYANNFCSVWVETCYLANFRVRRPEIWEVRTYILPKKISGFIRPFKSITYNPALSSYSISRIRSRRCQSPHEINWGGKNGLLEYLHKVWEKNHTKRGHIALTGYWILIAMGHSIISIYGAFGRLL